MNKIINKLLLTGDKLIPELYFKKPWFLDIASGAFTKSRENIQNFREIGNLNNLYGKN